MVQLNSAIANKLDSLANGVLNGHYIFNKDSSEDYLRKRFEKPASPYHNISYEFSTDSDALNQYFRLREVVYQEVHGHRGSFKIEKDEFDDISHIMLIKSGGVCVGGLRATISRPNNRVPLPVESEGLDLRGYFPDLDFDNLTYVEPTRFAILPEYRNISVTREVYKRFIELYLREGVQIGFGRCPLINFRSYRMSFEPMGCKIIPRYDVDLDFCSPSGIKMLFTANDFTADRRFTSALIGGKNDTVIEPVVPELVFA